MSGTDVLFLNIFSYPICKEIKRRIAMARQKAAVLASIWKDRNIKTATKLKVMKSMCGQYSSMEWRDGL